MRPVRVAGQVKLVKRTGTGRDIGSIGFSYRTRGMREQNRLNPGIAEPARPAIADAAAMDV